MAPVLVNAAEFATSSFSTGGLPVITPIKGTIANPHLNVGARKRALLNFLNKGDLWERRFAKLERRRTPPSTPMYLFRGPDSRRRMTENIVHERMQ